MNCIVNTGAIIDHDCVIGDHVHLAPGTKLAGNVSVEEGAFLGIGATVVPEINIGKFSRVGAGAVVINDISPFTTVVGVPAKALAHGKSFNSQAGITGGA
jgi:UDP-perosamine 4-acetyltransferase